MKHANFFDSSRISWLDVPEAYLTCIPMIFPVFPIYSTGWCHILGETAFLLNKQTFVTNMDWFRNEIITPGAALCTRMTPVIK